MKRHYTITALLIAASLGADQYGFSSYTFINESNPWHVTGNYQYVDKAKFKDKNFKKIQFAQGSATGYYTHFINEENSLTYGLGYDLLHLGWQNNPLFSKSDFNYIDASLGYVSTTLNQWRWIFNAGFSVDTHHLNFGKSAVYHGMMWGRYDTTKGLGINLGALGWHGVKHGRALPIMGLDWTYGPHWSIQAIFPLSGSVAYHINSNWSLCMLYENLGGPYKYPRRARPLSPDEEGAIFMVKSTGISTLIQFNQDSLVKASLGAGWNFGGSVLLQMEKDEKLTNYPFRSAPYAQGNLSVTF